MKFLLILFLLPATLFGQYTRDQHQHFWSGYTISQTSTLIFLKFHVKNPEVKGALLAMFAGATKEVSDHIIHARQYPFDPEPIKWDHWDDFTLTLSGGTCALLIYVAIIRPILIRVWPWFKRYNSEYIEWDSDKHK